MLTLTGLRLIYERNLDRHEATGRRFGVTQAAAVMHL